MATLTQSSARTAIDIAEAAEIARMARKDDPNILATEDMASLLGSSAVVLDGLRRQTRYFDGRFLTGADLTRDQDYIRQRQDDLARATGTGIIQGLQVSLSGSVGSDLLVIEPGHGVTPSGDIVMVTTERQIAPLDIGTVAKLDTAMGLRAVPRLPLGRRTGLFILALRPVEFTANPIAAYPTSVSGPRSTQDGDIIEATAITLIPYTDTDGAGTLAEARRNVARRIFLGQAHGLPQDALPLALVALDRGAVRWIDGPMVRRETGADTPLVVSMGGRPRALAEAFVLQHQRHLADVLADRAASQLPANFAASQYFAALPAAGQLPVDAISIDALGFRQLWFPPTMQVDISFCPSDEIATLVEESLSLPPTDLQADAADLAATGVLVLAPVSRPQLQSFERTLDQVTTTALSSPAQGISRAPAQTLAAMLAKRTKMLTVAVRDPVAEQQAATAKTQADAWRNAWLDAVRALPGSEGQPKLLWYVRRRAVAYQANVVGVAVAVTGGDAELDAQVNARIAALGLADTVTRIEQQATPFAVARMVAFLGAPRLLRSDILLSGAVADLEAALPTAATPAPAPAAPVAAPASTAVRPTLAAAAATDLTGLKTLGSAGIASIATRLRVDPAVLDNAVAKAPATSAATTTSAILAAAPATTRPGLTRLAISRLLVSTAPAPAQPTGNPLTEGDVIDVASDYSSSSLGDGLDRLAAQIRDKPIDQAGALWIGQSGQALDLDTAARGLSAAALADFATKLPDIVGKQDGDALAALIAEAD